MTSPDDALYDLVVRWRGEPADSKARVACGSVEIVSGCLIAHDVKTDRGLVFAQMAWPLETLAGWTVEDLT